MSNIDHVVQSEKFVLEILKYLPAVPLNRTFKLRQFWVIYLLQPNAQCFLCCIFKIIIFVRVVLKFIAWLTCDRIDRDWMSIISFRIQRKYFFQNKIKKLTYLLILFLLTNFIFSFWIFTNFNFFVERTMQIYVPEFVVIFLNPYKRMPYQQATFL